MRRHDTHQPNAFGSVSLLERRHAGAFYDAHDNSGVFLGRPNHERRLES